MAQVRSKKRSNSSVAAAKLTITAFALSATLAGWGILAAEAARTSASDKVAMTPAQAAADFNQARPVASGSGPAPAQPQQAQPTQQPASTPANSPTARARARSAGASNSSAPQQVAPAAPQSGNVSPAPRAVSPQRSPVTRSRSSR